MMKGTLMVISKAILSILSVAPLLPHEVLEMSRIYLRARKERKIGLSPSENLKLKPKILRMLVVSSQQGPRNTVYFQESRSEL